MVYEMFNVGTNYILFESDESIFIFNSNVGTRV